MSFMRNMITCSKNNHERDVCLPSEFLRTSRKAFYEHFHIKFLQTFPHKFHIPARGRPGAQRYVEL